MKREKTISKIMLKHHQRIVELFDMFTKNIGKNFKITTNSFEKFEEELKGHISIEEKIVFKFFDSSNQRIFSMIQELIKEHDTLLEMLSIIKNDLIMRNKVNPSVFRNLLFEHKDFEDKNLYPEMDRILDQSQKTLLIKDIDEIIKE